MHAMLGARPFRSLPIKQGLNTTRALPSGQVADDLYDYEEDVVAGSFNCLRMFVAMYGGNKVRGY